jgi:lysophospholipase L1-like esterase
MLWRGAVIAVLGAWLLAASSLFAENQPNKARSAFEWKDGDKVALIGGTIIEREQNSGYWELALTRNIPAKYVTFRNLGWSGDTVWAESRGIFEPSGRGTPLGSNKGYVQLIELVKEQKPSVLIFGYGAVEAFDGSPGLEPFVKQYEKLIADCKAASADGVRLILLGPLNMDPMQPPLPPPHAYNEHVAIYRDAIRDLAKSIGATFVPMSMPDSRFGEEQRLITDNGQHLKPEGYSRSASQLVSALTPGLPKEIKTGDAESLRQLIVKKNEFFFHRYRPQNVTYIFLFRKHEQGNNAVNIPKYDPLIAELEQQISRSVE